MRVQDLQNGDYIVIKDGRVGRIADRICSDPLCPIKPYHIRLGFDTHPKVLWVDIRACGFLFGYDPNAPLASEILPIV